MEGRVTDIPVPTDRVLTEGDVEVRMIVGAFRVMNQRSFAGWCRRMWDTLRGIPSRHSREYDDALLRWYRNVEAEEFERMEPPRFYAAALSAVGVTWDGHKYREVGDG
jgi:hypothetical protein